MIADKANRVHLTDDLPEHIGALVELLETAIRELRGGKAREDVGRRVELIGIVMQRRT